MKKDIITALTILAALGAIFWASYVVSLLLERIF